METDIMYAIIKAAYEAWDTNKLQAVEGFSIIVIPDSAQAQMDAELASQGLRLDPPILPTFWIEHEGRRAQFAWHSGPPLGSDSAE